jgi:hypothetical protein
MHNKTIKTRLEIFNMLLQYISLIITSSRVSFKTNSSSKYSHACVLQLIETVNVYV